jgi:two-component system response regulator
LFASGPHATRDTKRQPDVVFSDLKLPKIDGLELVKRIRTDERTCLVPVVLLSSSTQDDDVRRAYLHGANSYVRKPVDSIRFSEVIRQLSSYWLAVNERAPPALQ